MYAAGALDPLARADVEAAGAAPAAPIPRLAADVLAPEGLDAVRARADAFAAGRYRWLDREADFTTGIRWADPGASPLWLYQLQYLGCVLDLVLAGRVDEAREVFGSWREHFERRWDSVAWHPYPASARLANLCLAAGAAGDWDLLGRGAVRVAAVHAAYVLRHLERDVRGNHLLENARALLVAGCALSGGLAERCETAARAILATEIPEQVLPDGAHFELSPMYHAIVLHRLIEARALLGESDPLVREHVAPAVERLASFLAGVLCPDGEIPLLGDSVRGFAPPAAALLALARRVAPAATDSHRASFPDAGLHVLRTARVWSILDAGPVCPEYLPAHGQADTLTVEVWVDGACVVADPGVYDYTGPERAWGRSSRAHSTITLDDADTSEVHGSFRVGGRATVTHVEVRADGVAAAMRPWRSDATLARDVALSSDTNTLTLSDSALGAAGCVARSRLHLHPAASVLAFEDDARVVRVRTPRGEVEIRSASPVTRETGRASREFGVIEPTTLLVQVLQRGADGTACGEWTIRPAGAAT